MRFSIKALLYLLLSCHCNATQLTFGVYAADKPTSLVKKFRPILDELETKLTDDLQQTVHIKMRVASSYEKGIGDLVKGKADFYRLGPASYIEAKRQNPSIKILAIESNNGKKYFNGIIAIPQSSTLQRIEDLHGRRFAFGSKHSTIGRYLSQYYLYQHGVRSSDLISFDYLDRHDKVASAVAAGLYDAGALKEGAFYRAIENGKHLKILAQFRNVTQPWVSRADLPPSIEYALREALLNFNQPSALVAIKKSGFLEGEDSDYNVIRVAIKKNTLFFK